MRIVVFLLFFVNFVFAQHNNTQNAYQFFQNGDYEKAIAIYKDLNKKSLNASHYYPFFTSYFNTNQFLQAEKLALGMYKKFPNSINYLAEAGVCQLKGDQRKKAEKTFLLVYKKMNGNTSQSINISNTFKRYSMYQQALDVYEKAEKLNKKADFSIQKAQLYGVLGKSEEMIATYLELLANNPKKKQQVTINIQKFLNNDGISSKKNYEIVKKKLVKQIQKEGERTDFSEMLIWLFMQNHQFELAFLQAKALDRRVESDGEFLFDIAETFLDNEYYVLAVQAYDVIIQKGFSSLYVSAHINRLYALTSQVHQSNIDLTSIDSDYQSVIKEIGINREAVVLLSNYAHFQAFYLKNLDDAMKTLEQAMTIQNASAFNIAECKLEYADILLLDGRVWESLLYYSQVEKDFKESPIGHKAKFKRAKVAFYQGDFDWAQAQLDVLKASTSKLISNDAMDLSLLITDNLGLDTTDVTMKMFSRAELLVFQKKNKEAIAIYDSILSIYKGHVLSDEIYFRKAGIYLEEQKIDAAIEMFSIIINEFSFDILADDALYRLAKIYENQKIDRKKSMDLYERILLEYKGSIFAVEARKRFRNLREEIIKKSVNDSI